MVPVHPELQTALIAATSFGAVCQGKTNEVPRVTVLRWMLKRSFGPLRSANFPGPECRDPHAEG